MHHQRTARCIKYIQQIHGKPQGTGWKLVLHWLLHVTYSGCCEVQLEVGMGPVAAG